MSTATSPLTESQAAPRATPVDAVLLLASAACVAAAPWLSGGWQVTTIVIAAALVITASQRAYFRRLTQLAMDAAVSKPNTAQSAHPDSALKDVHAWRTIVDTALEGIVTIDAKGVIQMINTTAARLFGYTATELHGCNISNLMPEPHRTEHDNYLERYRSTNEAHIIGIGREVTGRRKDGTQFPIDISVDECSIEGDQFFTAVIRDITEKRELQTKLAQSERLAAVGELAAGVAHEINNPINTMINCAQLIHDGDEPTENADIIIEEGGRIADIVRALLQFARDDSDQAVPTSIFEAVDSIMSLIGENWVRHGITVTIDVDRSLPPVLARPQKIQQILLNLLINSKDALLTSTIKGRQVSVTARQTAGGVELKVADNGPGITDSVRDRVFEPFITTKRAHGGTGLGLSVAKSILEDYGGTLTLCEPSDDKSVGAVFALWLPLCPDDDS